MSFAGMNSIIFQELHESRCTIWNVICTKIRYVHFIASPFHTGLHNTKICILALYGKKFNRSKNAKLYIKNTKAFTWNTIPIMEYCLGIVSWNILIRFTIHNFGRYPFSHDEKTMVRPHWLCGNSCTGQT